VSVLICRSIGPVVPGSLLHIPPAGGQPAQDLDLRLQLAQLRKRTRPRSRRTGPTAAAGPQNPNQSEPQKLAHSSLTGGCLQPARFNQTKQWSSAPRDPEPRQSLANSEGSSKLAQLKGSIGPREPVHNYLTYGSTTSENSGSKDLGCLKTGQARVNGDLGHTAQLIQKEEPPTPQFWAQLDSRVYASLEEARDLLQRQSQLMAKLESEPVSWPAKDDMSFSSLAADVITNFTI
jgi:hypothetical protein